MPQGEKAIVNHPTFRYGIWKRFLPMKISSHIRSHRTQAANQGFTLIELLVVISIIAVLAGLLFPAMGAVRNMARKTSAKNDVTQIVNAVKMFYTEYGRYPVPSGTTGVYNTGSANGTLMATLRYVDNATVNGLNPRKIRFLEIPNAKNGRSGLELTGSGTTATPGATADWKDPWGHSYEVLIDANYSGSVGSVTIPKHTTNTTAYPAATVQTEVVAYSKGNPDNKGAADPVVSWQ